MNPGRSSGAPFSIASGAGVRRFATFVIVGGTSFVIGLAVLWVLTAVLHWHYLISVVGAFIVVAAVSYFWNYRATFSDRMLARHGWRPAKYYLVYAGALAANLCLTALLVEAVGLNYLVANGIAALAVLFANFAIQNSWVFRADPDSPLA